jgi:hypothetical protein
MVPGPLAAPGRPLGVFLVHEHDSSMGPMLRPASGRDRARVRGVGGLDVELVAPAVSDRERSVGFHERAPATRRP